MRSTARTNRIIKLLADELPRTTSELIRFIAMRPNEMRSILSQHFFAATEYTSGKRIITQYTLSQAGQAEAAKLNNH